jgi:hypothetical protein
LGIHGIDEDSSLPRSGIAMQSFSDSWRVEQTPGAWFMERGTGDNRGESVAHINTGTFEAFMAFGEASMAFSEVAGPVIPFHPAGDAVDLLLELGSAHSRLRDLFAEGHDAAVCGLAPQVIELANRMADALGKDQGPDSI